MTCNTYAKLLDAIRRFEGIKARGATMKSYHAFYAEFLVPRGYLLTDAAMMKHISNCVRPNGES